MNHVSLTEEQYKRRCLNLGCGQFPIEGALNVDFSHLMKADIFLDLNDPEVLRALPHAHYDRIVLSHVLEHLDDVFGIMAACSDLLVPGGMLIVRVPHASRGFTHSQHKHGFDVGFPFYFNKRNAAFFYGTEFDLVSLRMMWAIRFDLYATVIPSWQITILRLLNAIITPLANLSPGLCSRIWCYWVGGFEQIEYIFRKPMERVDSKDVPIIE